MKFKLTEMLLVIAVAGAVMLHCTKEEEKVRPELVTINITHVVEPNEETVHDIARKYIPIHRGPNGYARFVLTIKHVNGMLDNPRALRAGERLTIPIVVEAQ